MAPLDLAAVVELTNRSHRHDGVPEVVHVDEFRDGLQADGISLAADTRVAQADGVLVGWVQTLHLPSSIREERCYVFGEVDPDRRGQGIGRRLLQWGIDRGRVQLRSTGRHLPRYLRVSAYSYQVDRQALISRLGFAPVRWFDELLRPLADVPEVPLVPGVRLSSWPDDRDAELLVVRNESFADHWGSAPLTSEAWVHQCRGFGARPDLSVVAVDVSSGQPVAFCLNHRFEQDDAILGRRDGWIATLGTLQCRRGQGIATALITDSLRRFADAGLTHASIEVDSASPTGADRLYRSLGFERAQRSVVYQIEV